MANTKELEQDAKRAAKAAYMREYKKRFPHARLYDCWRLIKRRCEDPRHKNFERYGARGIYLCQQWQTVDAFVTWSLENGWADGLQIDRIHNDGPYSPENCRWTTSRANNRNRSNNKLDLGKADEIRRRLANGEKGLHLAHEFGVHHSMIYLIKQNKKWI